MSVHGFKKDMSERVHLKVLYFYLLQHFTLTGGLGVIKGDIRGRVHPSSQLFPIACPWMILALKHIYLISDLKNDFLMI